MTSKRFEETKIEPLTQPKESVGNVLTLKEYRCIGCDAIFFFTPLVEQGKPPAFCPCCGRRNADA
jgi:DNA-directed RNA polymerase subunit RPC12/RpoP